jgi:hypothetical protein
MNRIWMLWENRWIILCQWYSKIRHWHRSNQRR